MITGIICEFNPFHEGHKYLINQVKENGSVICVMSSNVVQRGEFAVYDKFRRAKDALNGGADLVIELPCAYSLMSAQGFAKAAVRIIEACNVADRIAFGAECDDAEKLKAVAKKVKDFDSIIKEKLKSGMSYPSARREAVGSEILDFPNNILAIEYINSTSLPVKAIKRIGKGHDTDDVLYSSSAIRSNMDLNEICSLKNCEKAVLAKLRCMEKDDFLEIEDVNEGLENRIYDAVREAVSLDELYSLIKTKRYTHSRIRRIILKSYIGITKYYTQSVPYMRILGFNENGRELLYEIKKASDLPVISRYSDVKSLGEYAKRLFELECRCTDLFNLGYKNPLPCGTEQRSQVINNC